MFDFQVSAYWKGIIAAIGGAATVALTVVEDNAVSAEEWGVIAAAVATVIGVVWKRNEPVT